jgi:hypothetical protein
MLVNTEKLPSISLVRFIVCICACIALQSSVHLTYSHVYCSSDLDGDAVVAPFRFQALNIDEVANATVVIMVMIDGQQHTEMLLDGTKKISVGFSLAELLPPGTYTATLLLSDAAGHWDGDHFSYPEAMSLLGVDSPARKLVVHSDKRAFTKHAAFMTAQERCTQDLSILIALESSQVDDLKSLADRWHGPISAAVFISTADQAQPVLEGGHEIDTISRLRSLHAWATEHTGSCLTISLLFETTPSASWTGVCVCACVQKKKLKCMHLRRAKCLTMWRYLKFAPPLF